MIDLDSRAKSIALLILDIDGVLTDGGLVFDNDGHEYKRFNSLDGHGMRMLQDCDLEIAIITGRQSTLVEHRMKDLGVQRIYQGCRDKKLAFEQLLNDTGLEKQQIAYVGDDLPDLPVMVQVGLSIAVQNAHSFVKQHSHMITTASGGFGAVREVTDFILDAQSLLDELQYGYLR